MKLKISWFNPTVLRKDITRFAPLWGIYSVLRLLSLLGMTAFKAEALARSLVTQTPFMSVVNMGYAFLCAMFLFGDLFSARRCYALHAMPMRREGWFLTHAVAGLLFCLVPTTLTACALLLLLKSYWTVAFFWLTITVLQFLFFFGVAIFCAMCAGNRLGMTAIYLLLNYLSLIVRMLVNNLFMPLLYGLQLYSAPLSYLCPAVRIPAALTTLFQFDSTVSVWAQFGSENWQYLGGCAAVGLVFAELGLQLYRKRKLEYAGDFLALKALAPVFLVFYTLVVAIPCYLIGTLGASWLGYLFLSVGLPVGFFTGRMFLERKVNVFKPKNFLGFGIFATVLTVAIGLTWLDPLGLVRYVPEPADIKNIRLYDQFIYSDPTHSQRSALLYTPKDLAAVTKVHQELIDDRNEDRSTTASQPVTIVYERNDGRHIYRYYNIPMVSRENRALRPYFSQVDYVFGTVDLESVADRTYGVIIDKYPERYGNDYDNHGLHMGPLPFLEKQRFNPATDVRLGMQEKDDPKLAGLLNALREDCEAGKLPQPYSYYPNTTDGYIYLHLDGNEVIAIRYTSAATHTTAYLEYLFQLPFAPTV